MSLFSPLIQAIPATLEIESDGHDHWVTVIVAQSSDGRYLSLVTTMRMSPDAREAELKFEFSVDSYDQTSEPFRTMDRDIARNYLPPEVTGLVMPIVGASYRLLLASLRPERLLRVTKARYRTQGSWRNITG